MLCLPCSVEQDIPMRKYMNRHAALSEVKLRVRSTVLLLRKFTAEDIIQATGLNPESVRTELQRMKQEGLILSRPLVDAQGGERKDGRRSLYCLTDDAIARRSLSESIEAFYPAVSSSNVPTSRRYLLARQLINQASQAEGYAREQLLLQAEEELDVADQAEGGVFSTKQVQTYIQFERARLDYFRSNYREAARRLGEMKQNHACKPDEVMLRRIEELEICVECCLHAILDGPGRTNESSWVRHLLETIVAKDYQPESPLTALLLLLVRGLSQTATEKIRADAFQLATEYTRAEIREGVAESLQAEMMRLSLQRAVVSRREQSLLQDSVREDEIWPLLTENPLFSSQQPSRRRRPMPRKHD